MELSWGKIRFIAIFRSIYYRFEFVWAVLLKGLIMKKISVFLLIVSFIVSGCTFNVEVLTPESPTVENSTPGSQQLTPYATQNVFTPIATISATAVQASPTAVPPTTYPILYNARTSSSSNDADQKSSFPAGTKAVYALWDYQNMRQGLTVKREWYWNSQLWLTREEAWDFNKYGANGTVRDVSIYDNETGLNSGVYQLRLYIDNVLQPISPGISSPVTQWITFDIGQEDASAAYGSWDSSWGVEVYGEKRIVLKNISTGSITDVYTAREVPYVAWFNDSKHFLFVDRNRSDQKPGTTIGIQDTLWIVDVPSGAMHLLYKSDTSFGGRGGPVPSPDGKYVASIEGSGFADACVVDSRMIFFELASDYRSVKAIRQQEFSGLPALDNGSVYPVEDGYWENPTSYVVTMDGTCNTGRGQLGAYSFNMLNRTATSSASNLVPGDLGLGLVHGKITDIATGAPIANASVTCDHHSYRPVSSCSGTVLTNANGEYAFNNVFFHDTDTIEVTVQATGYETVTVGSTSFTINDLQANVDLYKTP